MYYFPNPFKLKESPYTNKEVLGTTVNSGKNAIRLALRSFELSVNSIVAIPAFSCNEVVNAVLEEKLTPLFVDLKSAGTFWADYNEEILKKNEVKAIVITHLYGFLHPDTNRIIEICKRNSIKLIHDAAQSFGIDENQLKGGPIIYSFGPGKSTTAARGGEIINLESNIPLKLHEPGRWDKREAEIFFDSRVYGKKISKLKMFEWRLAKKFMTSHSEFRSMLLYQREKAKQAKYIAKHFLNERIERYEILYSAITKNERLKLAYQEKNGRAFKIVIYIAKNVEHFIEYLKRNNIPYCRLADSMDLKKRNVSDCVFFTQSHKSIIEISTERSIPMEEIKRIASILEKYKNEN